MVTLNSLSGGKTSSYMAAHFPANFDVFAVVCIDDPKCSPKDAGLIQYANDKFQKFSRNKSEFIATAEDDQTLRVVRDLEQLIGREIVWVRDISFDELIAKRKSVPNIARRFCTSILKIEPIANFVLDHVKEPVLMAQGIRADESERQKTGFDLGYVHGMEVIGRNGKPKQKKVAWAFADYPLIRGGVIHPKVKAWAKESGLIFPEDSNCVGCFWKDSQQLRKNLDTTPEKMAWFTAMEKAIGGRWKKDISYKNIFKIGLQLDFQFGTGAGCQAGFCTD